MRNRKRNTTFYGEIERKFKPNSYLVSIFPNNLLFGLAQLGRMGCKEAKEELCSSGKVTGDKLLPCIYTEQSTEVGCYV